MKSFEPFTIGMMVEIDWYMESYEKDIPILFIITNFKIARKAPNGEKVELDEIEIYRIDEGRYFKIYPPDMERWLSNGNLRIIHYSKENTNI